VSDIDVIGASAVVAELGKIGTKAVLRTRAVVEEGAIDVRNEWRDNATATAGTHGKWYPSSIRYTMAPFSFDIEARVEPKPGFKQAEMDFEYGSHNQPPHLDGQKAIDHLGPLIARRIELAIAVGLR
jgi:hypothetical protein